MTGRGALFSPAPEVGLAQIWTGHNPAILQAPIVLPNQNPRFSGNSASCRVWGLPTQTAKGVARSKSCNRPKEIRGHLAARSKSAPRSWSAPVQCSRSVCEPDWHGLLKCAGPALIYLQTMRIGSSHITMSRATLLAKRLSCQHSSNTTRIRGNRRDQRQQFKLISSAHKSVTTHAGLVAARQCKTNPITQCVPAKMKLLPAKCPNHPRHSEGGYHPPTPETFSNNHGPVV